MVELPPYPQQGEPCTPLTSIFINTYLLCTCYLFKPTLLYSCKWGISVCLKSKTHNGSAAVVKKDLKYENISCFCILKNFMASSHGFTASVLQNHYKKKVVFLPKVPGNSWYSSDQPKKDEKLSSTWSHSVVLELRPLYWEFSTLTTRQFQLLLYLRTVYRFHEYS